MQPANDVQKLSQQQGEDIGARRADPSPVTLDAGLDYSAMSAKV